MKILVVEDDERISDAVVEYLSDSHYAVEAVYDGQSAWELLEVFNYDMILLDVMMPMMDGMTLCRKIRKKGISIPILMLTAKDTLSDKIQGLDAGADDYLIKPFELEELSARIRALLRRGASTTAPILTWGNLSLDPSTCEVFFEEKSLPLSPKEYKLLEFFLRNGRRVFSRAQILEHLWSFEQVPEEATVKAHIRGLRQKLEAAGAPSDIIETVYGLGYRLREKPE